MSSRGWSLSPNIASNVASLSMKLERKKRKKKGKSTTLYRLKLNDHVATVPTIGFNLETLDVNGVHLAVWDVGGQDQLRVLWRHYYKNAEGVIYILDCGGDTERLAEAKIELYRMLEDADMGKVPLLVFANKQDLPGALSVEQVTEKMSLKELTDRSWCVQPCSALNGRGLTEGLQWLSDSILAQTQTVVKT